LIEIHFKPTKRTNRNEEVGHTRLTTILIPKIFRHFSFSPHKNISANQGKRQQRRMMRSTLAHRATTAALMNRPCLTELLTKSLVIWHYDCAAAAAVARGGNRAAAALAAPGTSAATVSATPSFRGFKSQTSKRYFNHHNKINSISNNTGLFESDSITTDLYKPSKGIGLQYQVPQRIRQKVISASDAASLVRDGDTVCVTGFVSQGKYCGAM
jgi:hypothetical protein